MRGLRIIPLFIGIIILSYFGMWFVELNGNLVVVNFHNYQTPPTKLGFVVLTAVLIGMVIAGLFCSIELLALFMQNRRLRARLPKTTNTQTAQNSSFDQDVSPKATGRFT